ncbi:MAG: response regulator [Rhodospirillaceae bacterium]|nr:response regulator [Rhodospirillaceae bacterium]
MIKTEQKAIKILIVEDDSQTRFFMRSALIREGFKEAQSYEDARQSLDYLSRNKVDVALIDCDLDKHLGGIELVSKIRDKKTSSDPTLPIILIVPAKDSKIIQAGIKAGVNDFIVKPVSVKSLVSRVIKASKNRGKLLRDTVSAPIERRDHSRRKEERRHVFLKAPSSLEKREGDDRRDLERRNARKGKKKAVAETKSATKAEPQALAKEAPSKPASAVRPLPPPLKAKPNPAIAQANKNKDAELSKNDLLAEKAAVSKPGLSSPPAGESKKTDKDLPEDVEALIASENNKATLKRELEAELLDASKEGKISKRRELEEELSKSDDEPAKLPAKPEEVKIDLKQVVKDHDIWLLTSGKDGANANLVNEKLSGADLHDVVLTNANMKHVDLGDALLKNASFEWADLRQAYLSGADLSGACLHGAKLRHADLSLSRLEEADFRAADLAGANLKGAHLDDADFAGANLLGANLEATDMKKAQGITQGQFDKAQANEDTVCPPGIRYESQDR